MPDTTDPFKPPVETRTDQYVSEICNLIDGECLPDAAGILIRKGTRAKIRAIIERARR